MKAPESTPYAPFRYTKTVAYISCELQVIVVLLELSWHELIKSSRVPAQYALEIRSLLYLCHRVVFQDFSFYFIAISGICFMELVCLFFFPPFVL